MQKIGRRYLSKVTAKGQITLPPELRRQIGIVPGEYVQIELDEQAKVIQVQPRVSLIDATAGMFRRKEPGPPMTVEEMDEIIKKEAVRRYFESLEE